MEAFGHRLLALIFFSVESNELVVGDCRDAISVGFEVAADACVAAAELGDWAGTVALASLVESLRSRAVSVAREASDGRAATRV